MLLVHASPLIVEESTFIATMARQVSTCSRQSGNPSAHKRSSRSVLHDEFLATCAQCHLPYSSAPDTLAARTRRQPARDFHALTRSGIVLLSAAAVIHLSTGCGDRTNPPTARELCYEIEIGASVDELDLSDPLTAVPILEGGTNSLASCSPAASLQRHARIHCATLHIVRSDRGNCSNEDPFGSFLCWLWVHEGKAIARHTECFN